MNKVNQPVNQTIIDTLLYDSVVEPQWNKLPRSIKRGLLQKISGSNSSIGIGSPNFCDVLSHEWRVYHNRTLVNMIPSIECSICLETQQFDDKITTLLCGHKFCSTCILTHIRTYGGNCNCPLCRKNVFDFNNFTLPLSQQEEELDRKRQKRRLERREKRRAKREDKKKENL